MPQIPPSLYDQLLDAVKAFADETRPFQDLLRAMANDVARATAEPLELFPVAHHSPSSALHMVRRLHRNPPKVIYMEGCEDMMGLVEHLQDCQLPVALQAFAGESDTFPPEWLPVSVVAPLTEASAEYQAIAYTLRHPETQLVFVDRAADFVFQWQPPKPPEEKPEPPSEEAAMHGTAVGLQVGSLVPTFDQFLYFLLKNSKTRHFAEWYDQYVEQAILGTDYHTYRQVMFLIGSLMRRLGRRPEDVTEDRLREQYMWTRIKQHMAAHHIDPHEALHVCGAAHTASDVAEFGVASSAVWQIPERTQTRWLYGLLPSSFAAIEYQFGHPAGTVSLAESSWKKGIQAEKIRPFTLEKSKKPAPVRRNDSTRPITEAVTTNLTNFLTRPPTLMAADEEQLLAWCTDVVALARKNGYLSSTADSIAIYHTSLLLANMRNRPHPSPYDFQDAAITCLEKDRTPKKRNIAQICQILLGGDRVGTVGYASLPPLAQDVYDRLTPLNLNLFTKTNQRALMDFKNQPELLPCSDVLWRLNYLLGHATAQPIMGERSLGHKAVQESWEVRIGKNQHALITLGYEGVTLEQVLERRLRQSAFAPDASASVALKTAEHTLLLLPQNPRLVQDLGEQAIALLKQETGATDAPAIFDRARRLVHYYRATPGGLPDWLQRFVATGYTHYTALLPQAFGDRGTSPEQIAGMLGFVFTLENLALALGCQRSQLSIAVQQAGQETPDPAKLGLLWTTEWLLQLRPIPEMRAFFDHVLANPLLTPAFPDYLNGFILALGFAPGITSFVVELLSRVFASLPDGTLLPWLPGLILRLRPHAMLMPALLKEASASYPATLAALAGWQPPWETQPAEAVAEEGEPDEGETAVRQLLLTYPATILALEELI